MAKAYMLDLFSLFPGVWYGPVAAKTISGVVTDALGNPISREVRLFRWEDFIFDSTTARAPYAVVYSDPDTGEYSFTVNENDHMRWVVMCIGKDDENILAHNHVRVD